MKVMRLAASPAPDLRRRMLSELFGSAIFAGDCSEGDQPMDHRSARLLSELPAEGSPWNSYLCHSNSRAGSPSVQYIASAQKTGGHVMGSGSQLP